MKILITGAAGFIGSALAMRLLGRGDAVFGIDNHNDYYDPALKEARLHRHINHPNYQHFRLALENREAIFELFEKHAFDTVVNLAAQAGVRHSIENPYAYVDANVVGFLNILEGCRQFGVSHLVYASSSSVYGANTAMPFSVRDNVDHPLCLYAATKKSGELMAHVYSHLYQLPTTGLRFFTVYGPWDRPDMALQKFARAMVAGEKIQVFNHGKHERDFTYIDDIVDGILRVINKMPQPNPQWSGKNPDPSSSDAPWRIYNIGGNRPQKLTTYIEILERALGVTAKKEFLPRQPGDVVATNAEVWDLQNDFDYQPKTPITVGVENFAKWFKAFYG